MIFSGLREQRWTRYRIIIHHSEAKKMQHLKNWQDFTLLEGISRSTFWLYKTEDFINYFSSNIHLITSSLGQRPGRSRFLEFLCDGLLERKMRFLPLSVHLLWQPRGKTLGDKQKRRSSQEKQSKGSSKSLQGMMMWPRSHPDTVISRHKGQ